MNVLAKTVVSRPRFVPLILRASLGIAALVVATRLNLAVVLHGWQNDWSPELTYLVGLAPAAALVVPFCWLAWRDPSDHPRDAPILRR